MRATTSFALALACLTAGTRFAAAQAYVHPHRVYGTVTFSNVNPEIRAEIDRAPARGTFAWEVIARTTSGTPLQSITRFQTPVRTSLSYEMTVESADSGIPYDVRQEVYEGWDHAPDRWIGQARASIVALPAPAPDSRADLVECASLVRLSFHDEAGAPMTVTGGEVDIHLGSVLAARADIVPGSTSVSLLGPGMGETYSVIVRYTSGTDVLSDLVQYERGFSVSLSCDEIVDLDVDCGETFHLGRMVGTYDVVGEDEVAVDGPDPGLSRTYVDLNNGPWLNRRSQVLLGAPASGAFALENLVPNVPQTRAYGWQLETRALLAHAGGDQELATRQRDLDVPDGATVDLGNLYVMTPGWIEGDMLALGPPPSASPGGPVLEDAVAGVDYYGYSQVQTAGAQPGLQATMTNMLRRGGGWDSAEGSLRSDFELAAVGLADGASAWNPTGLELQIADRSTPSDPASYRDARVTLTPEGAGSIPMAPGVRAQSPIHACFGQLNLSFVDLGGTFTVPAVNWGSGGSFDGIDFEGRDRAYTVAVSGVGTPTSGQPPAATGLVVLALPEGDYELRPSVGSADPGGGTTRTQVQPVHLTMGCRQVVTATPHSSVSVTAPPPCSSDAVVAFDVATDASRPIESITWSVNGAAPELLCAACGVNPSRSFGASLRPGANEVLVTSVDEGGHVATSLSFVERSDAAATDGLRLRKTERGAVRLTWTPGSAVSVFEGTLASLQAGLYDHHAVGACGVTASEADLVPQTPGAWFVVATPCGGLGHDSFGRARPPASPGCD